MKEIVELWKKLGIVRCLLTFDCGGDSMGSMEWQYFDKKETEITDGVAELTSFFEDEVFRNVEFYVNSDGHYIGENGTVTITLEDDEFDYVKEAMSEFSESYTEEVLVELTKDEKKFIEEKIENLGGGENGWRSADDDPLVNYKVDCILTNKDQKILEELMNKLDKEASEHQFISSTEEPQDDYTWATGEINIKGNLLEVNVTREFYEYRDSD
jgi:hypothetical protein